MLAGVTAELVIQICISLSFHLFFFLLPSPQVCLPLLQTKMRRVPAWRNLQTVTCIHSFLCQAFWKQLDLTLLRFTSPPPFDTFFPKGLCFFFKKAFKLFCPQARTYKKTYILECKLNLTTNANKEKGTRLSFKRLEKNVSFLFLSLRAFKERWNFWLLAEPG